MLKHHPNSLEFLLVSCGVERHVNNNLPRRLGKRILANTLPAGNHQVASPTRPDILRHPSPRPQSNGRGIFLVTHTVWVLPTRNPAEDIMTRI
ncbi:hypothetical protein DPMN_160357 [Dreissena polymorpha]|uniref:Uncharacterized protein n=1 Tax=Dreissena polymorpha TaxID=45954 RepID=A0A9D4ELC6_DREPO|nr:hypothetical protein DPMN_160357 [Dreissena polymorpha]